MRTLQDASTYFNSAGLQQRATAYEIAQAIPEHTIVTTVESGMPFLYHNRTIRFFPVDLEHADYAVLNFTRMPDGSVSYSGAITFLGPREQALLNDVVTARMRRDGYDLGHPVIFPSFGLAVVKRLH